MFPAPRAPPNNPPGKRRQSYVQERGHNGIDTCKTLTNTFHHGNPLLVRPRRGWALQQVLVVGSSCIVPSNIMRTTLHHHLAHVHYHARVAWNRNCWPPMDPSLRCTRGTDGSSHARDGINCATFGTRRATSSTGAKCRRARCLPRCRFHWCCR